MPVTIIPSNISANVFNAHRRVQPPAKDSLDLLERASWNESKHCIEILQSSFTDDILQAARNNNIFIEPSANGFVHDAVRAYNFHHHLQIRPEDIWFAILSQLSIYINAHSSELRHLFVAHSGKKELKVLLEGDRYSVDFGVFARIMTDLIDLNVKDKDLRSWALPTFTTTTETDKVTASIILMGVTQKYFDYKCICICGLPSITLLGSKADYQTIHTRLSKLKSFGSETHEFARLLRPVLSGFIASFDHPNSAEIKDFWGKIAHHDAHGSGPEYYSGWITAFCYWNNEGSPLYGVNADGTLKGATGVFDLGHRIEPLTLNGKQYPRVETGDVPSGYSSVPVIVVDGGVEFDTVMVAGSVGIRQSGSGQEVEGRGTALVDTLQPETGWWIFEVDKDAEMEQERRDKVLEDLERKRDWTLYSAKRKEFEANPVVVRGRGSE